MTPEYHIRPLEKKRPPNHLWVDALSPNASPKLKNKKLKRPGSP